MMPIGAPTKSVSTWCASARDGAIVEREVVEGAQASQQRDAQGGARRHAAADRNRRGNPHVEALDLDAVAAQTSG